MAVKRFRLTGTKPGRGRPPRRIRYRSRRGGKSHGGSVYRSHKGGYPRQAAFRAHANRAIKGARFKAAKPWRAKVQAAYKGIGTRNPYPKQARAKAYKAVGRQSPRSWEHPAAKARKYKAARAKRVT